MSGDRLFAVPEPPEPRWPAKPLSADRRRTIRNKALLDHGIHPATRGRVTDEGTCGTCQHAVVHGDSDRSFWKCAQHRLGMSASAASDIRKGWPSCELYVAVAVAVTEAELEETT